MNKEKENEYLECLSEICVSGCFDKELSKVREACEKAKLYDKNLYKIKCFDEIANNPGEYVSQKIINSIVDKAIELLDNSNSKEEYRKLLLEVRITNYKESDIK